MRRMDAETTRIKLRAHSMIVLFQPSLPTSVSRYQMRITYKRSAGASLSSHDNGCPVTISTSHGRIPAQSQH
jgi:hypothetical protein